MRCSDERSYGSPRASASSSARGDATHEHVADDLEHARPLAGDRRADGVAVGAAAFEQHDGAADRERGVGLVHRGGVHERRGEQRHERRAALAPAARRRRSSWSSESVGVSSCSAYAAMRPYPSSVPWCQSTPFGRPVVPPVYQRRRSSPERSMRGAARARARSASYSESSAVVVDLDGVAQARHAVARGVDTVAQRAVVHEHLGVGVVDELHELVAEVAEVDVGRHRPQLRQREQQLHVLGAVVQEQRDLGVVAHAVRRPARSPAARRGPRPRGR